MTLVPRLYGFTFETTRKLVIYAGWTKEGDRKILIGRHHGNVCPIPISDRDKNTKIENEHWALKPVDRPFVNTCFSIVVHRWEWWYTLWTHDHIEKTEGSQLSHMPYPEIVANDHFFRTRVRCINLWPDIVVILTEYYFRKNFYTSAISWPRRKDVFLIR